MKKHPNELNEASAIAVVSIAPPSVTIAHFSVTITYPFVRITRPSVTVTQHVLQFFPRGAVAYVVSSFKRRSCRERRRKLRLHGCCRSTYW